MSTETDTALTAATPDPSSPPGLSRAEVNQVVTWLLVAAMVIGGVVGAVKAAETVYHLWVLPGWVDVACQVVGFTAIVGLPAVALLLTGKGEQ